MLVGVGFFVFCWFFWGVPVWFGRMGVVLFSFFTRRDGRRQGGGGARASAADTISAAAATHAPPIETKQRERTCASMPNSFWKMPKVPGPHTSCVISLSTCVHTFIPGATPPALPLCRARIFSVIVMARLTCC